MYQYSKFKTSISFLVSSSVQSFHKPNHVRGVILTVNYSKPRTRRDFSSNPLVKNMHSTAGNMDSIPGQGIKIPHAQWHDKKKKKKNKVLLL